MTRRKAATTRAPRKGERTEGEEAPRAEPEGGGGGADLNAVIRRIIRDLMAQRGWGHNETARRLGLKPATLHAFLSEEQPRGITVSNLSRVLEAQKLDPVEFFRRHPDLRGRKQSKRSDFDARLAALLTPRQREYLARAFEVLARRKQLDEWVELVTGTVLGPEFDQLRRSYDSTTDKKTD